MDSWMANEWRHTLASTQEYLHHRIFGSGCARDMIEAWRCFYQTHEPIVRTMVLQSGMAGPRAEKCIQEVWLDILTEVPKLRLPISHDAFLYWLSQLTQTKVNLLLVPGQLDLASGDESSLAAREGELLELTPSSESPIQDAAGVMLSEAARTNARLFQLRVVEERLTDDVAHALGLTSGQVESRRRSMLQRILSILINMDATNFWFVSDTASCR